MPARSLTTSRAGDGLHPRVGGVIDRTCRRAAAVVSGTPHLPHDPATEVIVADGPVR